MLISKWFLPHCLVFHISALTKPSEETLLLPVAFHNNQSSGAWVNFFLCHQNHLLSDLLTLSLPCTKAQQVLECFILPWWEFFKILRKKTSFVHHIMAVSYILCPEHLVSPIAPRESSRAKPLPVSSLPILLSPSFLFFFYPRQSQKTFMSEMNISMKGKGKCHSRRTLSVLVLAVQIKVCSEDSATLMYYFMDATCLRWGEDSS